MKIFLVICRNLRNNYYFYIGNNNNNNQNPKIMTVSKIHFVASANDTAFIHGKKSTICGQNYQNVGDYTSVIKFITCEKCKAKASLI